MGKQTPRDPPPKMGLVSFKILVAPFIFGGGKNITFSNVFGGGGGFCAAEGSEKKMQRVIQQILTNSIA